jgi:hypothetical protein
VVEESLGLRIKRRNGEDFPIDKTGYVHFKE